jgi:hypothetical protein
MAEQPHTEQKDCEDTSKAPVENPPADAGDCVLPVGPCWEEEKTKTKCKCKCPPPTTTKSSCLQDLINTQQMTITRAETAEAYKKELEAFVAKIAAAEKDYTSDKYKNYKEQWAAQSKKISGLLSVLDCNIGCWDCFVICEICSLVTHIIDEKKRLYGDYSVYAKAHSLRDLKHWWETEKLKVEDELQRILAVLTAWEKPADTIKKTLDDNGKLIDVIKDGLTKDQSKAIFALLFKLIPSHLAIAPRVRGNDGKFTLDATAEDADSIAKFQKWLLSCCGDVEATDAACGPDIGQMSIRNSLTGPLPFITAPAELSLIICCVVQGPYTCAKTKLAHATAEVSKVDAQIANARTFLTKKPLAHLEELVARLPTEINCELYKRCDDDCDCHDQNDNGDDKDCGCKPKQNTQAT